MRKRMERVKRASERVRKTWGRSGRTLRMGMVQGCRSKGWHLMVFEVTLFHRMH